MSQRSVGEAAWQWRPKTLKAAARRKAARRAAKRQKAHLLAIKGPDEVRRIMLGGRFPVKLSALDRRL